MQNVIEIAISLILVFLLISLIVTAINEIVSRLLGLRGKMLLHGLEVIIDDDNLRKKFYANGLLTGKNADGLARPSYIAPQTFAKALAMAASLKDDETDSTVPSISIAEIEEFVAKIKKRNIRDILVSALADASGSLKEFETSLATWYESAMDRVAGNYKRYKQALSFSIGLVIAVSLNIDALNLALTLSKNDEARAALIATAVEIVAKSDPLKSCSDAGGAADTDNEQNDKSLKEIKCLVKTIDPLMDQLSPAAIGWPDPQITKAFKKDSDGNIFVILIAKLLGWLTTAFAVTLGAPFWFDLLKRFVNIRGTGVKPQPAAPPQ